MDQQLVNEATISLQCWDKKIEKFAEPQTDNLRHHFLMIEFHEVYKVGSLPPQSLLHDGKLIPGLFEGSGIDGNLDSESSLRPLHFTYIIRLWIRQSVGQAAAGLLWSTSRECTNLGGT